MHDAPHDGAGSAGAAWLVAAKVSLLCTVPGMLARRPVAAVVMRRTPQCCP